MLEQPCSQRTQWGFQWNPMIRLHLMRMIHQYPTLSRQPSQQPMQVHATTPIAVVGTRARNRNSRRSLIMRTLPGPDPTECLPMVIARRMNDKSRVLVVRINESIWHKFSVRMKSRLETAQSLRPANGTTTTSRTRKEQSSTMV